jgi:predicted nucleotidyltransferase
MSNDMGLLAELFASRTRAEIISAFTSRPGEKLYLREVSRLIKADVRSVKQELDRLQRLGFLTSEASGNRRYLQVNESFPLYPELKAMALKTMGLGEALRAALADIGGIDFAFVYGSVAKGKEKAESDLGLFVLGSISGPILHKALAKAKAALNREINTSRFGLDELKKRLKKGGHFLSDIMKGKKIFVLGTENEFRRAVGSRKA